MAEENKENTVPQPVEATPVAPQPQVVIQPTPQQMPQQQPIYIQQVPQKKGFPVWGWFCLGGCGCLFIIGVATAVLFGTLFAALLSVGTQVDKLTTGICDTVNSKGTISSYLQGNVSSDSNLLNNVSTLDSELKGCTKIANASNVNYSNNNGDETLSFTATVQYSDGSSKDFNIVLKKDGSDWKIKNISRV